jgi:hypothetical protein
VKLIDSITKDPNQIVTIVLEDGSRITLTLVYKENQRGWFSSISYGTIFNVNNRRIVSSPNMLRAFRGIINFGLACVISDGYEPVFVDDFSTGRAKLYTLNQTDVDFVETTVIGQYA